MWKEKNEKNLEKGQHFLIDRRVLKKEIEISNLSYTDKVLEIGAGEGVLTRELAKSSNKVLSFEIDERYKNKLKSLEKKHKNLKIIYSDATKYSWKGFDKLISNIPYYLGEKVITKAIIDNILFVVLIVGENFKEILMSKSTKSGILANIFYNIKPIEKIKKSSFCPPPSVNSWMVKLTTKRTNESSNFIRYILERKGKLKNAIIYGFVNEGYTKKESKELLKKLNIEAHILESSSNKITGERILMIYNCVKELL